MLFRSIPHRLFGLLFVAGIAACSSSSSSSSTASTTNGVNDVLKACELRAPWQSSLARPCTECVAIASAPRCPCSDKDYAGRCSGQQSARTQESTCDGVDSCVNKCERTDCACIDACYAGKSACRTAASALDGCLADTCDAYCR